MRVPLGETEEEAQRHAEGGHVPLEGKIAVRSYKPEIATDCEQS